MRYYYEDYDSREFLVFSWEDIMHCYNLFLALIVYIAQRL